MEKKAVSPIMLTLLLIISMSTLACNIQPAKASGTIYIREDGSVDPPTPPIQRDGDIYTFTDNIYDEIEISRSNLTIDGKGYTLQGTGASDSCGIRLGFESNVTIKNVEIKAFYDGIVVHASTNNSIRANNLIENEYGIILQGGSGATRSSMNTILGNNATDNHVGIYVATASNNSISGNNIANNDIGIVMNSSPGYNNKIIGNNITNNDTGISLLCDDQATIYHNYFVDNTEHTHSYYYRWTGEKTEGPFFWHNVWDDGYPSGGNYWSDHNGVDADGDGIGDTPYVIDEGNRDRYPLMGQAKPSGLPMDPTIFYTLTIVIIATAATVAFFMIRRKKKRPEVIEPPKS